MAAQTVASMTAAELLVMPHNGYRYELVQGELRQMEFADRQHGRIAANFIGSLIAFVKEHNLGKCIRRRPASSLTPRPIRSVRPTSVLWRGNALRRPQKNAVFPRRTRPRR